MSRYIRFSVVLLLLTALFSGTTLIATAQNPQDNNPQQDPAEKVNPPRGLVIDCDFTDCDFDELKKVGVLIMRYLIWFAIFGLVALITWTGFLLATNALRSGDVESEVRAAKGKLLWAIFGLVLVLSAWLLVEFLFVDVFKYDEGNPLVGCGIQKEVGSIV